MKKILIIEDDEKITEIEENFESENFDLYEEILFLGK